MTDYTPCYRLDLRDWLDTIERKPDAQHSVSQCGDSDVAEKPRPAAMRALQNTGAFPRTPTEV